LCTLLEQYYKCFIMNMKNYWMVVLFSVLCMYVCIYKKRLVSNDIESIKWGSCGVSPIKLNIIGPVHLFTLLFIWIWWNWNMRKNTSLEEKYCGPLRVLAFRMKKILYLKIGHTEEIRRVRYVMLLGSLQ